MIVHDPVFKPTTAKTFVRSRSMIELSRDNTESSVDSSQNSVSQDTELEKALFKPKDKQKAPTYNAK